MQKTTLQLCALILAGAAATYGSDTNNRWSEYRKQVISPRSVLTNAAGAGIGQARDDPYEWGQGFGGYAKRFGSRVAHHAVKGTIQFGVAVWHNENLHYERSNLEGKWPRLKYAVVRTWWVPRKKGSGDTVAVSRISGNFGSALISRAWQPASTRTVGRVFSVGFLGAGIDTGVNVLREFWPWKKYRP